MKTAFAITWFLFGLYVYFKEKKDGSNDQDFVRFCIVCSSIWAAS